MTENTAVADGLSEEDLSDLIQHTLANNGTLKDIRGLTAEHMEAVYSVAYNLYEQGKYEDAHDMFSFLGLYDHLEKKYWVGLGACRQMMKRYDGAIEAYSMASMLDVDNPEMPLHAAECHLALGNLEGAESGAFAARHWANERGGFDEVRDRAEVLLKHIEASKAAEGETP